MADDLPELQPYDIQPIGNMQEEFHESSFSESYDDGGSSRRIIIIVVGVIVLLILLALLFLMFGGNDSTSDNTNQNNQGNDTTQNITLFWWGVFLDEETVQPIIDDFEGQNPSIDIEYTNIMNSVAAGQPFDQAMATYQNELNVTLDNGNPTDNPDIFMINNSWVGDYESYTQPSPNVTIAEMTSNYYPAAAADFANSGVPYGLPLWMDTYALVFNNDLLAAAGINEPADDWTLLKEQAEQLTVFENNAMIQGGFSAGLDTGYSFNFELIQILFEQNGVTITDNTNAPIFASDSDAIDAVQFVNSFQNTTWSADLGNESKAFLEGKLAMLIVPSWRYRELLRVNEELDLNIDIRVTQIPQLEGQGQDIINWADYWGNVVSQGRPYTNQAWNFVKWLNEPAQQRALHESIKNNQGYFGHLYPRSDMQSELLTDEFLSPYNDSLPFASTWYMVKGREVRELFIQELQSGVSQARLDQIQQSILELQALKGFLTTTN